MADRSLAIKVFDATAVATTGTATSDTIRTSQLGTIESILFQATVSSGTPDISIELLVSPDDVTYTASTEFTDLLVDLTTVFSGVETAMHRVLMPVVGAPFMQLLVTGLASNPANTTLELWLVTREINS